jgi:Rrf2 family protein
MLGPLLNSSNTTKQIGYLIIFENDFRIQLSIQNTVKVNTKTRYGIRAMMEIALHTPDGGIFQKDIAVNQEISNKYLDHIIHAMKVAGLVQRNGHKGGYILSREPDKITILDIHNAFEFGIKIIDCLDCIIKCPRETECSTKDFWLLLNQRITEVFQSHTLKDLIDGRIAPDDSNS